MSDIRYDENGNQISIEEAVKRWGPQMRFNSESIKVLPIILPYIPRYNFVEVASGGWQTVPWALTVELPEPQYSVYTGGRKPEVEPVWRADCHNLPFKDNTVSGIMQSHLLEDFHKEEWPALMKEWMRVLQPGGVFISLTPDRHRWQDALARGQPCNCAHRHEPIFGEVGEVGKCVGFELVEEKYCLPYPEYSVLTVFRKPQ